MLRRFRKAVALRRWREVLSNGNAFGVETYSTTCFRKVRMQIGARRDRSCWLRSGSFPALTNWSRKDVASPKNMFVDDADQAVQFHQRVLEWRSGEKQLVGGSDRIRNSASHAALRLEYIPQPLGFVDDH